MGGIPKVTHLNVNEVFGPTVQGEGPYTGQRVSFLRLAGCNLTCSWCDTPYAWDWERYDRKAESHRREISDLGEEIQQHGTTQLVVTGGEPLSQQKGIVALRGVLPQHRIHVETNGTIVPNEATVLAVRIFAVSPKLAHAGDPKDARLVPAALETFAELAWQDRAFFKFVAKTTHDLTEIATLVRTYRIPNDAVWVMPEGADRTTHLRHMELLADGIVAHGWNLGTRLHVLAWGTKRAV